jgi:alpha/beta superfamily hydrolase
VATLPAVAVRTDRQAGIREEAGFLGGQARIFSCLHLPLDGCRGAVLVCSPILADFGANYRREVELGRRLAARGVAVQRFHYRGSGHSDGERVDLDFESMFDDAWLALDHLRGRAAGAPIALVGTRCGALVAAEIVRGLEGAPAALWEPVLTSRSFVREAIRARAVHAAKRGREGAATDPAPDPVGEVARDGWLDVLGMAVGRSLLDADESLEERMGGRPRPVLLVQLDPAEGLRRGYESLAEVWRAGGFDVDTARCPVDETWWFTHDRLTPIDELLDLTIAWIDPRLEGAA